MSKLEIKNESQKLGRDQMAVNKLLKRLWEDGKLVGLKHYHKYGLAR